MKRNRNGAKRREQTIQVWTLEQARRVLPYVASIMTTLRESKLEAQQHELSIKRLDEKQGRANRGELIAREDALAAVRRAEDAFQEALDELHTLDIYCLDAIQGLALIPFAQDDQLAWFVFNLFDKENLRFWRYHEDPLETRRPIAAALAGPSGSSVVI